jgi:hypothetical protein
MWIFKDYKLLSREEHETLLAIRNEERVRESSHSSDVITLQSHLQWVKETKECYFALFVNNIIVGGVNYKKEEDSIVQWGIFFTQKQAPSLAPLATYIFIEYMFTKVKVLYSEVLITNKKALKFNLYFGLQIREQTTIAYSLELQKEQWNNYKLKKLQTLTRRIEKMEIDFQCKK